MRFPEEINDDVGKRLRRLEGQVRGVLRMLEDGRECEDIVTQLAACRSALDRVSYRLVAAGMQHCVSDPDTDLTTTDLERLFLKLS